MLCESSAWLSRVSAHCRVSYRLNQLLKKKASEQVSGCIAPRSDRAPRHPWTQAADRSLRHHGRVLRMRFLCRYATDADPLLTNICACRSLCVHAKCQQRMMHETHSHADRCGVCQQRYKNVSFEKAWVYPEEKECDFALLNALLFILLFHLVGALAGCIVCKIILLPVATCYAIVCFWSFGPQWRCTPVVHAVSPPGSPACKRHAQPVANAKSPWWRSRSSGVGPMMALVAAALRGSHESTDGPLAWRGYLVSVD